jgi:hypothetical protein
LNIAVFIHWSETPRRLAKNDTWGIKWSLRKITIKCAWLNRVKTNSASTAEEDPCPLALARRTPHRRPAKWLTLSTNGEANAVAKKQHQTRRPTQAKITGRASLSPPVARSLGLDVSNKSSAEKSNNPKWRCREVKIQMSVSPPPPLNQRARAP